MPYQTTGCIHINSLTMTNPVKCVNCKNYDKGIRPTGAMPILGAIQEKVNTKSNNLIEHLK